MPRDAVSAIWIVMAVSAGLLVGARVVTLRRRPEIWWTAYTITFAAIALGCTLMVDEDGFNHLLGVPNLAHLLADLCIVFAGWSVVNYLKFLLWQEPRTVLVAGITVLAAAAAAIMITGWVSAPIHDLYYPTARDIPIVGGLIAYELTFHLYVLAVLCINVAFLSTANRVLATRDPAGPLNVFVGISVVIIGVGQLIHLVKLLPAFRSYSVMLGNLGDLITLIGIVGSSAVNMIIFFGPRLRLARRSHRLLQELEPLSTQLLRAYPVVHVSSIKPPPWRLSLRAERVMIEIGDALSLLRVDEADALVCPFAAVTHSLRSDSDQTSSTSTVSAMSALPRARSRAEEENLLLELSRRVRSDAS